MCRFVRRSVGALLVFGLATACGGGSDGPPVLRLQTGGLYAADGKGGETGNLYRVNPVTGDVVEVGPIGYGVTGLALAPDGRLYGTEANRYFRRSEDRPTPRLILIDPDTGVGTVVEELRGDSGDPGSPDPIAHVVADATFVGADLIGWSESVDRPVRIDLTTGHVTVIGQPDIDSYGSGVAANTDGTVFGAFRGDRGPLYTVDPATGVVVAGPTLTGTTTGQLNHTINAMTFLNETLYAVASEPQTRPGPTPAELYVIDPGTGTMTFIAELPPGIDALAVALP